MKVIITMSGLGSRFSEIGIKIPKYKIIAKNKSIFEWSMLSLLDFYRHKFIFIIREEALDELFLKEICSRLGICNYKFVILKSQTDGQATTAIYADKYIDDNESCIIYNIDTYVKLYKILESDISDDLYGFIPVVVAEGTRWSFVKLNDIGMVEEVSEKKPISNLATIGFYYFKTWSLFKEAYRELRDSIILTNKEVYIAPIYNYLLNNRLPIGIKKLSNKDVFILGTPEEIKQFDANYLKNNL